MTQTNAPISGRFGTPVIALVLAAILAACSPGTSETTLAQRAGAPLFEGMGDFHREITTSDPDAQKYFDQGMVLAFGFNHAESIRSFRAAQTLDPSCAMCFWGEALATGPNINVTANGKTVMSADEQVAAYAALQKAVELAPSATPREQDVIAALEARYAPTPVEDRTALVVAPSRVALGILVCENRTGGLHHRH